MTFDIWPERHTQHDLLVAVEVRVEPHNVATHEVDPLYHGVGCGCFPDEAAASEDCGVVANDCHYVGASTSGFIRYPILWK